MGGLVEMLGGGSAGQKPKSPDYAALNAEAQGAKTTAETYGNQQIQDAKSDFGSVESLANPVADRMAGAMDSATSSGTELLGYLNSRQRPVEDALQTEAMQAGSVQRQEEMASRAAADTRQGVTANQNAMVRQALRYGISPSALGVGGNQGAASQALAEVTAANAARTAERDSGFAKKMSVQQMYAPQAQVAQGLINTGVNAGAQAVTSKLSPIQAKTTAVGQGVNTIMSGRQMALQGVGNMISSQTQKYNTDVEAETKAKEGGMGAIGTIAGAAIAVF